MFFCFCLSGQEVFFNAQKMKSFKVNSDTLILDSLTIVPGTVTFTVFPSGVNQPVIDYDNQSLVFLSNRPDSIKVNWRVFPYNLNKPLFHKSISDLYPDRTKPKNAFAIQFNKSNNLGVISNDGLVKNGNISRGISFGNNQDVVVNSNLNLQVSGKLSPEIDILLAATDNNIPFQADGTTAQLQEFDKVFIQLNNKDNKLVVGDYQLSKPQKGYFMNFYKRSQGMFFENNTTDTTYKSPLRFKTQLSGAVSRGKFSRQVFLGVENNQGPYRLRGADNELFIIVLSGTEKIYIDGKLLQRGQENDYIIDYNTSEITFTAKQQITKDKRIVAEFQYAERNYSRSLFYASEEVTSGKTTYFINFFNEQDNPARPLQQELSQEQKEVMVDIGDTLTKAIAPGVERVEFSESEILYRLKDTVVNDILYTPIYVFSQDVDSARYRLKFSYVGENKGNYVQLQTLSNGKVYKWVAPSNGQMQGNYEPVIPLVTPKLQQMLTAGISHSFNANSQLIVEGVYTKNDINRFSGRDKKNDEGSGVKVISNNSILLKEGSNNKLILNGNYEFVQKQFKQVERFRSVEFDRDWNRALGGAINNDQQLYSFEAGISSNSSALTYSLSSFTEGQSYSGIKHGLGAKVNRKNIQTFYNGSFLEAKNKMFNENSNFYRHYTGASLRVAKIKFGLLDELELNRIKNTNLDSLKSRAYQFHEWEASIQNADSGKTNIKLFYKERTDKLAFQNALRDSTLAKNIGVKASVMAFKNNPFSVLMTYRKLDIINQVGTALKPDNTLLNRLEYSPRWYKGFIVATVFYETGYGLENKREFYYLEVAPGQGQYAWQDYNDNGIKELSEFEVAVFSDQAKFIRVYTPTNQYIKVLQNQFSASYYVRPSILLKTKTGKFSKFASRFNFQSTLKLDNKINDNNQLESLNPFSEVNDTALISSNNNIRHSIFFNQSSPVFGADYTIIDNKSRQILLNGLESRSFFSNEFKLRVNLRKNWSLNTIATKGVKENNSQFLTTRNYIIESDEVEQRFIFQPTTAFRISSFYKYSSKKNQLQGLERAEIHNFGLEWRVSQSNRGSLTCKADYFQIDYLGDVNSPIAYEMLNGLKNGRNFTLEINFQRNLGTNIQISLNYNGRKTGDTKFIHLGGAQVRAYF